MLGLAAVGYTRSQRVRWPQLQAAHRGTILARLAGGILALRSGCPCSEVCCDASLWQC